MPLRGKKGVPFWVCKIKCGMSKFGTEITM